MTAGEQVQAPSSKHIPIKRSQAEDVWETLHLIALDLARGNGSLKKRLINVLLNYAQHIGSHSFPPQLREQWKKIEDAMHRAPSERTSVYLSAEDEMDRMSYELGSISWSVKAMGRKEARSIAEIFVSLYDSVCRELGTERPYAPAKVVVSTTSVTQADLDLLAALKLTPAQRLAEIDKLTREIGDEEQAAPAAPGMASAGAPARRSRSTSSIERSSTAVPSGRSVGSSRTRRRSRT